MHEVDARSSISPLDLSKMLFNQIGTCSTVLVVPVWPHIVSHLVIMGFLNLLLEPKLSKDLNFDQAGGKTLPTVPPVLENNACTYDDLLGSKRYIYAQIADPVLYSTRFADGRDKLLNMLLVQTTECLGVL